MPPLQSSGSPTRSQQVSACLREPLNITLAHLRANARLLGRLDALRARNYSQRFMRRHAAGIRVPRQAMFQALSRDDTRSRIIASFHYGDYVFGLNTLMAAEANSRRRCVITLKAGSAAYFNNLARAFGDRAAGPESELILEGLSMLKVSRLLRAGSTTLVLFCDLPPNYGAKLELEFLGRRALFGRGAATLAVTNSVPILPVICQTRSDQTTVFIEAQLEPVVRTGESRTLAISRLSESLIGLLEHHVLQDPSQWRYLSLLPAYIQFPQVNQELS